MKCEEFLEGSNQFCEGRLPLQNLLLPFASFVRISRVERKTMVTQTYFWNPLFRGNLDPFVNNANLGAIAHTSNGT